MIRHLTKTCAVALVVVCGTLGAAASGCAHGHAEKPEVQVGAKSGDRSKAVVWIYVAYPSCGHGQRPPAVTISLERGPHVGNNVCVEGRSLREGLWSGLTLAGGWKAQHQEVTGGVGMVLWPLALTAGLTKYRWSVRVNRKTIKRGVLEVRTVITKPRAISKDKDVDDFQNICLNQQLAVSSRDGGHLYCLTRRAVRWNFQFR